jgi:hypothetical protein
MCSHLTVASAMAAPDRRPAAAKAARPDSILFMIVSSLFPPPSPAAD